MVATKKQERSMKEIIALIFSSIIAIVTVLSLLLIMLITMIIVITFMSCLLTIAYITIKRIKVYFQDFLLKFEIVYMSCYIHGG